MFSSSPLSTYTLFFLLLTFLGLGIYIFQPFLIPLLLALIFTVTTYPLFEKLVLACRGHRITAAVIFLFAALILLVFIVIGLSWLIWGEVFNLKDVAYAQLSNYAVSWFNPVEWNKFINENIEKIQPMIQKIPFINEETVTKLMESALNSASEIVKNVSAGFVGILRAGLGKIGGFFINLIYFFLASLYFLVDGQRALKRVFFLLPIKKRHIDEITRRFTSLFKSWVIGNIAIMIVQGTLGGIGFALAGIPSPAIWGLIITFTSLVPFIGTSIIMIPGAILLLISGHYIAGIFLLIWSIGIVGTSDNIIRPMILKEGAHISILVLLFALLGGLQVFGFKGLLLGPIIVVFLDVILHIYSLEYGSFLKRLSS